MLISFSIIRHVYEKLDAYHMTLLLDQKIIVPVHRFKVTCIFANLKLLTYISDDSLQK